MAIAPFKAQVGRQNIRSVDVRSGAELNRVVNEQFQALSKDINAFCSYLDDISPEVLVTALEPTFELSQVYVPVDKGDLKRSGFLEVEKYRGGARAVIGYAKNGIPDYAVFVHENTEVHHDEPTKAKFLESAIDEDYYQILQRITDNYKATVGA